MNSPLCQLNGGCMGCCGHDYKNTTEITKAIAKNTKQFHQSNPQKKIEFMVFRDRYDKDNLNKGVCRNLIERKGCFLCPLHPAIHTEDLRVGHCDTNYLCPTAKQFSGWHKRKKEEFLAFVETKHLSNVEYSLAMDKGTLLEEFHEGHIHNTQ